MVDCYSIILPEIKMHLKKVFGPKTPQIKGILPLENFLKIYVCLWIPFAVSY